MMVDWKWREASYEIPAQRLPASWECGVQRWHDVCIIRSCGCTCHNSVRVWPYPRAVGAEP